VERRGSKAKERKGKERKDDRMNAFFWAGRHLVEVQWLFVFCALFFWGSLNWEALGCAVIWVLFLSFFRPFPPPPPVLSPHCSLGREMVHWWGHNEGHASRLPALRWSRRRRRRRRRGFPFNKDNMSRHSSASHFHKSKTLNDKYVSGSFCLSCFGGLVCNVIVEQPLPPPVVLDFTNHSFVV
jgi:hypothetical protein